LIFLLPILFSTAQAEYLPKSGDIIFQTSQSSQSKLIQAVTLSPFSHVGVITIKNGQSYVYEAIKTVQLTPLKTWIARGQNGKYSVYRLKEDLNDVQVNHLTNAASEFQGQSYDIGFKWSDEQLYCSELVWKVYKNGLSIELIEPRPMKSYVGLNEQAKQEMYKRWGNNEYINELTVAPSDLAKSHLLELTYSNY
jgi:hypothetical protein